MRWASALSRQLGTVDAFREAAGSIERQLGGHRPDLVLLFASPDHARDCESIAPLAAGRFPSALLVGCTGGGVIGEAREAEEGPGLSLTAAALPGVAISPFHLETTSLPPPDAVAAVWHAIVGAAPEAAPKLLLLADPFTFDAPALIDGLDRAYPGAPKFGGLVSGGRGPGENRLLVGGEVHRSGAVGVAFSGNLAVDTVIAQGCRPIGKPMLVTRCRGTLMQELDGRAPLAILKELYATLGSDERELMRHALFVGLEMRQEEVEYEPGELLVRNLLGVDQESGALAVGADLRPMIVAQFMLRDARTAEQDLRRMLERQRPSGTPAGALLFSCLGRGARLFGRPDHDTGLFEEKLGPAPLGGFFCNGEIGPVGGATYLHGYTSAFALFRSLLA